MRETLKRHIDETFGVHLHQENDVGLVIDGKVRPRHVFSQVFLLKGDRMFASVF